MTQPGAAPGWYPTPDGGQRYFDGVQWTQHVVPPAARLVAPTVIVNQGPNHLLHLILTLLTCGLWIPVWIIIAIISASGGNRQTIIR
ncbi:DUF2510 domain-containing protein [Mycobacteroides chelonae]|uniref:DUF2510 domain-containing protein n=1 Tax=Mycobacteroides chelonae TaxID=1774 RepID=UPI000991F259|nr:DUF2510 domain-containing protein [Mycobacteroides chelonae]